MGSGIFEILTTCRRGEQFGIIVRLSWGNQTMADMKTFARTLADEAKQKLAALAEADKMQLHRARVLDAKSRPFWDATVAEMLAGITEYDSCLTGTTVEQQRSVRTESDMITVTWRYPRPEELVVRFDFERRLIATVKRNLNGLGDSCKEFHLSVERDDSILASDESEPIGGPTELAQTIMKRMLAGSMA